MRDIEERRHVEGVTELYTHLNFRPGLFCAEARKSRSPTHQHPNTFGVNRKNTSAGSMRTDATGTAHAKSCRV